MNRQKPAIIKAIKVDCDSFYVTAVNKDSWEGSKEMNAAMRYPSFRQAVNAAKKLAARRPESGQEPCGFMAIELT